MNSIFCKLKNLKKHEFHFLQTKTPQKTSFGNCSKYYKTPQNASYHFFPKANTHYNSTVKNEPSFTGISLLCVQQTLGQNLTFLTGPKKRNVPTSFQLVHD